MSLFIPKKLVEYNFSYPKRKVKKTSQPNLEYNEVNAIENQQDLEQEKFQSKNQNLEINHEEEDFWVDCKKWVFNN